MKKHILILSIIVSSLIIQACNKEPAHPGTLNDKIKNSSGTVTALLNGKPWISTLSNASYSKENKFDFSAQYYRDENNYEDIGFGNIDYTMKNNNIQYIPTDIGANGLFSLADDDLELGTYHVFIDSSKTNYITIDEYNESTHEIKGRFQVNFYKAYPSQMVKFDDTIRFTDGVFNLKIK